MARKSIRLPKRFPVGTKYIVEGAPNSHGVFQITRRFVVLPSGRTIDIPVEPRIVCKRPAAPSIVPITTRPVPPRARGHRPPVRAAL